MMVTLAEKERETTNVITIMLKVIVVEHKDARERGDQT
jgi:hypothetical protein